MALLKLESFRAGYHLDKTQVEVSRLSLEKGEVHFLLGPNGAGKSTLLRAVVNLAPYASGVLKKESEPAYLPSTNSIQEGVTGWDVSDIIGSSPQKLKVWAQKLGVEPLLSSSMHRLSSGEGQRVRLSCILSLEKDWILLDEPLSFLEVRYQFVLADILKSLSTDGRAFLIALHNLDWSLLFEAASATALAQGQCLAQGPVEEVLTHSKVQEVFGFQCRISSNPLTGGKLLALAPYERRQYGK